MRLALPASALCLAALLAAPGCRPRPAQPAQAPGSAAVVASAAQAPAPASAPAADPAATEETWQEASTKAAPAVVQVQTSKGRGSAFFLSSDSLVTDTHLLLPGLSYMHLTYPDGSGEDARVDQVAPELGLALLKLPRPRPGQKYLIVYRLRADAKLPAVEALGAAEKGHPAPFTRTQVLGLGQQGKAHLVETGAAFAPETYGGPLITSFGAAVGVSVPGFQEGRSAVDIGHAFAMLTHQPLDLGAAPARPAAPDAQAAAARPSTELWNYETQLEYLSRQADPLDARWKRMDASCLHLSSAPAEHGWFILWSSRGYLPRFDPRDSCYHSFEEFKQDAESLKAKVLALDAKGAKDGLPPGVRRELRRKYHLDCADWNLP